MKKTIGLFMGVVALLVVAMPARAFYMGCPSCQPDEPETPEIKNTNAVEVTQVVSSSANTGFNRLSLSGSQPVNKQRGCYQSTPTVRGTITTGDAESWSVGQVGVNVQTPCATCGVTGNVTNNNRVTISNAVFSSANTGYNMLKMSAGTGRITTGDAVAWSDGLVLVNVQVQPQLSQ